ncbi:MAG: class I SAM-dependent DNA methyltransferase [Candidatus Hodarchaeota archaeon]
MYGELAKYYDLVYSWKDYKKEADRIRELISVYKKSDGNELLDVACGTGKHLEYLKGDFSCTGIDISKEMLNVARSNVKGVRFIQADMVTLDLDRNFDVVISLFSSIGHVKTYENLRKTIDNIANHLKTGGVAIIEPWITKSMFKGEGLPFMMTYDGEDVKIARLNISKKIEGDSMVLEFHYLISEKNKDVRYFVDRREMGLFERDRTLEFMEEAYLEAEFLENGLTGDRGLLVGVRK